MLQVNSINAQADTGNTITRSRTDLKITGLGQQNSKKTGIQSYRERKTNTGTGLDIRADNTKRKSLNTQLEQTDKLRQNRLTAGRLRTGLLNQSRNQINSVQTNTENIVAEKINQTQQSLRQDRTVAETNSTQNTGGLKAATGKGIRVDFFT